MILLAHERTPELSNFVAQRPDTEFIQWAQFARIPAAIRQLTPLAGEMREAELAPKPARGIRVLFVDDSASVRLAYQQLLQREGFAVETANSIGEGYERAKGGAYDLVVIDYFLGDGSGDELCRKLKAEPASAETMLAIITASYREDAIQRCLEAGAVECMFKNEVKELFLARIGSLARQIEMQRRVQAERARLDGILGSVGDGVYGVDREGLITFINPMGLRLVGLNELSGAAGQPAETVLHHSAEDGSRYAPGSSALARAYAAGEAMTAFETVFWRGDGEPIPVEGSLLPLTIAGRREGSVVVFRDISERKSAERLRWELSHDALTGLYNARHFNHALIQELNRRREQGGYSALLYLDLDRYTAIVDTLGQGGADKLIGEIGHVLQKRLREGDVLARLDGDRFGLLLAQIQLDNLFTIADSFRELAHQVRFETSSSSRHATISVGVAVMSRDTPSPEYALEHARLACKEAKRRGRDQTQVYVGEHETRVARELESGWSERFRIAVEEDRFVLEAQPIVPVAGLPEDEAKISERQGWRLDGAGGTEPYLFELLVRMLGRNGEPISPSVFVPLAERVGMMAKIDLWIVQRALRELTRLAGFGERLAFSVNLSNQTLAEPEALGQIEGLVRSAGPKIAQQLVFEITETSEMVSLHGTRRFMQALKALGCRFALDDFGTGFSSFTHLRHLPSDFVKIEGSFVEGMTGSELDHKMVSSIASLAQSLGMRVIAEHVDSFATLAALRSCGVDYVQGHFLGSPKRLAEIDYASLLS
jgi:diguanylate cyclase (GGDEF)-like protein/PAS domain S-box-containing protein